MSGYADTLSRDSDFLLEFGGSEKNLVDFALGGSAIRFGRWDEKTQYRLGHDNIHVVVFDAPNVGDDDYGEGGGYTGINANTKWTESGNVPGASGGYRQLTAGSSQRFSAPSAPTLAMMSGQANWTWMFRAKFPNPFVGTKMASFYTVTESGVTNVERQATNEVKFTIDDADNAADSQTTAGQLTAGEEYYFIATTKAGEATRCGFHLVSSGRPTKWSDLVTNNTVTMASSFDNMGAIDRRLLGSDSVSYVTMQVKWMILANRNLIELD